MSPNFAETIHMVNPFAKPQASKKEEEVIVNDRLLDMVAPSRFDDSQRRFIEVGETVRDVHTIRDFPPFVDVDWFKVGLGRPRSITTFAMLPSDRAKLSRAIDHSDARQGMRLNDGGTASKEEEALRTREHGRAMLRMMGDTNESFYKTVVFEQLVEESERDLAAHDKTFASLAGGAMLTTENCVAHEQEAYFAASPFWQNPEEQFKRWGRDMCGSTIAAALPFQDNSIDDGTGVTLGLCKPDDTICRINTMVTTEERPSANIFVSGASGSGKTQALKHILYSELALGAKVIIVDCERDFKVGCHNGGGQWVDMGKGAYTRNGKTTGAWLSPLEPRLSSADPTEDDIEDDSQDVLRCTIQFLHGWAELAWSLSADDMPYLDEGLVRAYGRYGITFDTTAQDLAALKARAAKGAKPGEQPAYYPIFDDVKTAFDELEAESYKERHAKDAELYHALAVKARTCSADSGVMGNLWARRSNVDITNDFVVFDTLELNNADENVRMAQLFSIMTWIWSQACVSRVSKQFLRIVFDEGHMFFNAGDGPKSIMAARYINMMQKRIRKYSGGLLFATQNVQDVLHEDIVRYGEALITSSTYKLFFKTDATDLDRIQQSMRLTEFVRGLIANFSAGDCLLYAGSAASQVHVQLKPYITSFWSTWKD